MAWYWFSGSLPPTKYIPIWKSPLCWSASCWAPEVAFTSDLMPKAESALAAELNAVTMSEVSALAVKVRVNFLPLGRYHWPPFLLKPFDCSNWVALAASTGYLFNRSILSCGRDSFSLLGGVPGVTSFQGPPQPPAGASGGPGRFSPPG